MELVLEKFDSQMAVEIFNDFEALDFLPVTLDILTLLGSQVISTWHRYKRE